MEWVRDNRGRLIAALLTLARSYFADVGRVAYKGKVVGSFESWCRVVGGVLQHVGVPGFLGNVDELRKNNDADGGQWEAFFEAWHDSFGDEPVTVADVIRRMNCDLTFREMVPDWLLDDYNRDSMKFRQRLGQGLARQRNAQYGVWRLERGGENRRKSATWRVLDTTRAGEMAA